MLKSTEILGRKVLLEMSSLKHLLLWHSVIVDFKLLPKSDVEGKQQPIQHGTLGQPQHFYP